MFKKLVANLPFNPSLIAQVGFYTERLKQEKSVRGLSMLFIIATMLVQTFAVVAPPAKSLQASDNHIINGIKSKDDILRAWDAAGSDIPAIYGLFGVTREDILGMTPTSLFSNDGNDYWSIGRHSLAAYSKVNQKYKNSQVTMQYAGGNTSTSVDDRFVYHRQLRAWDINNPGGNWYYGSFKGTIKSTGETFWILGDCGNFTKIGKHNPPTPAVKIVKTIVDKPASLKPGDTFSYLLQYRNTVNNSLAENVSITDQLDTSKFDVTKVVPSDVTVSNGFLEYKISGLPFSTEYKSITITVKVKDQISSGTQICNASRMTASNSAASDSGQICIGVINPCPFDSTKDANNPNCTEPKLTCELVDAAVNRTTRNVTFKTTVTSTNPATTKVESYVYDFGDNTAVLTRPASGFTDQTDHTFALGKYTTKVTVNYSATGVEGKQKVDCSAPISFEDNPLGQEKAVKNITQDKKLDTNLVNTVQSDNVLEYELTTTNSQNYQRTGIDISDYIGDILDYAVLDTEFLKQQGGTFDENTKKVIWTNITVPANGKVLSYFRVKIKNPIPTTNSPSTVSGTFDCKIGNEYGNQITINIDCPLVKGVESLPNTGPGSSLAIMTGITFVVAYFFYRSRLLAREMDLIRNDYAATGGM